MLKVVVFAVLISQVLGDKDPQLTLKQGKLRGFRLNSRKGREFLAFQKIPYAKSPVGDLRFKSPQPLEKWEGVLDATREVPKCTQKNLYRDEKGVSGQEDCLYLNVYTPYIEKHRLLDVMVYIHGGGWIAGSGIIHEPSYLLDKDVVLVTFNYRLGPLGFLSTGDSVCPGNNGFKDQVAALRWVRDNIAAFGGNPGSVTIFGESAGGASVHYHVLSPMSKGLFHRAISQSGTAFCMWALAPYGSTVDRTEKLASALNCSAEDSKALIQCLREKDAKVITGSEHLFRKWGLHPMIAFPPVVETGDDAFIPATPLEMFRNLTSSVPWINGINSGEGAFGVSRLYGDGTVGELYNKFEELAPITLYIRGTSQQKKEISRQIEEFYFGGLNDTNSSEFVQALVDLYTDRWFLQGADQATKLHAEAGLSPVYYYYFDYRGSRSHSSVFGDKTRDFGVCHADELMYLFPLRKVFPGLNPTKKDLEMVDIMTTLWYNFAHTGDPTPTPYSGVIWTPVTPPDHLEYLKINKKGLHKGQHLLKQRVEFWESLELNNPSLVPEKDEL